jgi:hypothetical protein
MGCVSQDIVRSQESASLQERQAFAHHANRHVRELLGTNQCGIYQYLSSNNAVNYVAGDVCQAEVTAVVKIR